MYSLIKNNNSLIVKTKYFSKGERLRKNLLNRHCSLCRAIPPSVYQQSNFALHHVQNQRLRGSAPNLATPLNVAYAGSGQLARHLHTSFVNLNAEPLKPSSKIERTVTALKEKASEADKPVAPAAEVKPVVKKSFKQKVVDEIIHYYHGFRLLFIDINVSRKLLWRVLNGNPLTRREHKLLVRTVGDLFRLVPFSVFIIVPFMELLLPVFIKFFPGMLPSTFQTTTDKDAKIKQGLKVKLEMAKFLQKTLDELPASAVGHYSEDAKEFAQFFEKVRTSGMMTTSEEIMKFSKLFEDEITLDSLPRPQLMALCRVLDMNPIGTTNFLRFQLRMKLRSLAADDMMIQKEGINSLNQSELQAACRARGMRALGVSEERLKAQLSQWLDLSLVKKVPPSLLLLSQAFMLPDSTPTEEKLAATIQALPDAVGMATKAVIGEREGKVDFKTKIDVIKEEVAMIKRERKEQAEEEIKEKAKSIVEKKEEILVDSAPTLMDTTGVEPSLRSVIEDIKKTAISEKLASEDVTNKEMEALENALETLGKDRKKLLVEKEELQELREEMAEYQEDIADLQKITAFSKETEVKESVAAKRLFKKVNKMISKMETVLSELETIDPEKPAMSPPGSQAVKAATEAIQNRIAESDENLRIEDLINTVRKIQGVPASSLEKITDVLTKMDADNDGVIRVDVVLKMLELVGNEKIKLSKKQISELVELIDKEEAIEMDEFIYKNLKKSEKESMKVDGQESKDGAKVDANEVKVDDSVQQQPATPASTPAASSEKRSEPPKKPLNLTPSISASMQSPTITQTIAEPKTKQNNTPKEL
uniref:Mitochondrial proton/calcium exchanger protein n=2 Tax=Lygus hesperus TaxID=30085 RepID=A0A146KQC4_LYGHE